MFSIRTYERGQVPVLELQGILNIGENSDTFFKSVKALLDAGKTRVVIDLSGLRHIDSSGISVIVRLDITARRQGAQIIYAGAQGRVRDALTVTRLVEAIPVYESVDAALAA